MPPRRPPCLSTLPEQAIVHVRYAFVIIGPCGRAVATNAAGAQEHTQLSDIVNQNIVSPAVGASKNAAPVAWGLNILDGQAKTPEGIYCAIGGDCSDVACIRIHMMESFTEALPSLANVADVRNTCYVFVLDSRFDVKEDVLSVFNQGITELTFNYEQVRKKSGMWRMPKLRAVLLMHETGALGQLGTPSPTGSHVSSSPCSGNSGEGSVVPSSPCSPHAGKEDPVLKSFIQRLSKLTKGGPLRAMRRVADFDSCDALYKSFQGLSNEMHDSKAKRISTSMSPKAPESGQQKKTRVCLVQ